MKTLRGKDYWKIRCK